MVFGIVPTIVPTFLLDVENPLTTMCRYIKEPTWRYIRLLASIVGHTFYIEPGRALDELAYWGPQIKSGAPQPALNINMDAHTNCESLRFQLDGESRVQPYITVHEPTTKLPIPIPIPTDLSVLNPPLGVVPLRARKSGKIDDASKLTVTKALFGDSRRRSRSSDAVPRERGSSTLRDMGGSQGAAAGRSARRRDRRSTVCTTFARSPTRFSGASTSKASRSAATVFVSTIAKVSA